MKIKQMYMRFFYLFIVMMCFSAYAVLLYSYDGDFLLALKSLLNNFGVGIIGAVLSLIVIRTQLESFFDDINLKNSGIKGYRNGYPEILESLGGVDTFFSLRINRKIDVFGIAMAGFFEENDLINLICDRARRGYKVRVFFADPNSKELKNQEVIENKPGILQLSIRQATSDLMDRLKAEDKVAQNVKIYHLKTLPRAFIIRSGNRMIVTNYLYEGPSQAPSIFLKDDEYLNAFEKYLSYIDSSSLELNSTQIKLDISEEMILD